MAFFRGLIFLLSACLFCSCSESYMGKELYGSDEFVMDSYRILDGKFSILEMQGVCSEVFDRRLPEEYYGSIYDH